MSARIRALGSGEGEALKALRVQLAEETDFLMRTPEETRAAPAPAVAAGDHRAILVAERDGELIGFIALNRGSFLRNAHVASFSIGVLRAHWGRGAGLALLRAGEAWCRARGVERLELGVIESNARARAFYERQGFKWEGLKERAIRLPAGDQGEVLMAKWL